MKITVVPAQVTTVEDRIVGSLSFSQMLLLIVPVFGGAGLFAILPPAMGNADYKYIVITILALMCCVFAIRIKGKILAVWLVTILRYNLRPKYYLFNKNVITLRENYTKRQAEPEPRKLAMKKHVTPTRLNVPEAAKIFATIENPAAKVRFETGKKGDLYVRFTEIEKQD